MAQMVRVYTILPGAAAADDTFNPAAPFPVVRMEVEAANPEWFSASAYEVRGCVRDYCTGITAALGPLSGALQDANWNTQNDTFEFALPATITGAAAAGGFVEVKGWVRIGAAGPGAEVDIGSTEFVWT